MKVKDIIGICDSCNDEILPTDKWVENEDGALACSSCLEDFTVDDWLEFTHHKWGTSEIPHSEVLREMMEDDRL